MENSVKLLISSTVVGTFDEDDWGTKNWAEFDATCVYALRYYLDNGLIGGGYSEKYALNKLDAAVGSADVRDALYRILTKYNGSGDPLYQKSVDEMSDEHRIVVCPITLRSRFLGGVLSYPY